MSNVFMGSVGDPSPDMARAVQLVAVFELPYCANTYALNGIGSGSTKRGNLVTWSEEIDRSVWAKNFATIVPDDINDRNGDLTADRVDWDGTGSGAASRLIHRDISVPSGTITGVTFGYAFDYFSTKDLQIAVAFRDPGGTAPGIRYDVKYKTVWGWVRFFFTHTFAATAGIFCRHNLAVDVLGLNDGGTYLSRMQITNLGFPTRYQKTEATNELETSTCQATDKGDGKRCFYTFPTCQDIANFDGNDSPANMRQWAFSMRDGYEVLESQMAVGEGTTLVRPYIVRTGYTSQKIDPRNSVTQSTKITLIMNDDKAPGIFDFERTVRNSSGVGSFWRLWAERYRNFPHRKVKLWMLPYPDAVIGNESTGAKLLFTGQVDNIRFIPNGTVEVILKDILKKSREKTHSGITSSNVLLTAMPNNGSSMTINVSNAREFTDPAAIPTISGVPKISVHMKIESEILEITARDTVENTLDVTRFRFGTSFAAHVIGEEMKELMICRSTATVGLNPIDIMLNLHLRSGLVESDLLVSSYLNDRDTWIADKTMSRTLEEPESVEQLLREIRELMFSSIWVDVNQQVKQKMLPPSIPTNLPILTDAGNFVELSVGSDLVDQNRVNRIILFYDPVDANSGDTDVSNFNKAVYVEDTDATDSRNYGKTTPARKIFTKWFENNDKSSAEFFAKKMVGMYRNSLRQLQFDIDIKDSQNQVGDSVFFSSKELVDAFGNKSESELFIIDRKRVDQTKFRIVGLSLRDKPKYGFIAPNGTLNYPLASAVERAKYVFTGDEQNRVNDGTEEGYFSW